MTRGDNRYIVIHPWDGRAIAWNPHDHNDLPTDDCAFIGGVVRAMESHTNVRGLTFYVTPNVDRLPSYGEDVVAIVLGDEWCRAPRYAHRIRATFKTYGTKLAIDWNALLRPSRAGLAGLAQDARTSVRRLPYAAAAMRHPARVYDLPLGYYRQVVVPFVPIAERAFDVYFAGSFRNDGRRDSFLRRMTPKSLSREAMIRRLEALARCRPDLAIRTAATRGFGQGDLAAGERYSQDMMQTKLCVVPRGTSLETYRFFEGLRAGCVVVCERLPRRRYYDGSPALRVASWAELDTLVPALLADPLRLDALSRASRDWWAARCDEDATGAFIAARIRTAPHELAPTIGESHSQAAAGARHT